MAMPEGKQVPIFNFHIPASLNMLDNTLNLCLYVQAQETHDLTYFSSLIPGLVVLESLVVSVQMCFSHT